MLLLLLIFCGSLSYIASQSEENLPDCLQSNDIGYEVLNQTSTDSRITIFLERTRESNCGGNHVEDVKVIQVDVIEQTRDIARIRITDPSNNRWEPPLPKIPEAANDKYFQSYAVVLKEGTLVVQRNVSGVTTKLASFDIGRMVFTDNLIQITSSLPSSVIYGLGERKGRLLRSTNNTKFTFHNRDGPPTTNTALYGTHPLYVNIESDGRANGMWLLNSNAMDVILKPDPSITYRTVGGILDFFVFNGPTPADVVRQYQKMVGTPAMIPYWSLGYHLSKSGYKSTEETREVLERNLKAGIRVEAQWHDVDYMNEQNDFTIDPKNFKDLGDFVDGLHKNGRRYVCVLDPAVSASEQDGQYPPYDRGVDYDIFIKDFNGSMVHGKVLNPDSSVFIDFTHPNATAYWTEMLKGLHDQVEFDGIWLNLNEPVNLIKKDNNGKCPGDKPIPYVPGDEPLPTNTLCNSDKQFWSNHYDVHNMYGYSQGVVTHGALSQLNKTRRPFILSRSTFSGQGNYTGHWTGDIASTWEDLRDSVSGLLEFSLYGMPLVGADICGYTGNASSSLCARWHSLGAFYPFARNHNSKTSTPQDPAAMSNEVQTVAKKAFYWRYKFLPYLYTLFFLAHRDGDTVARPLFFEFPKDNKTYDIDDQFMLGPALMIVPALVKNQQTLHAYFPQGVWYDPQNRTAKIDASSGGKYVDMPVAKDTINFFVRGGHAVFYQEPGSTTAESRRSHYGVYICLNGENSGANLFIDDGETPLGSERNQIIPVIGTKDYVVLGTEGSQDFGLVLDKIHIFGIKQEPSGINVDHEEFKSFVYDAKRELLTIHSLNHNMLWLIINILY